MPKRESQVEGEFNSLFEAIDRTYNTLGNFEKRIDQILKPADLEKEPENAKHASLVPTADKIREARFKVIGINRTLARISDRVEL